MNGADGARRDVIVIGASLGGVEALHTLVSGLKPDLHATVLVVLHVWARGESSLPQLLGRAGPLPSSHPRDREPPEYGNIYAAPPDMHLLIEDGRMRLSRGPKENMHRPSVDVLFRTAAQCFGSRVIGVILTGYGSDGAAGLAAVKRCGGLTIVQDPAESKAPAMPQSALRLIEPDFQLRVAEIATVLNRLVQKEANGAKMEPAAVGRCAGENRDAMTNEVNLSYTDRESPSAFICPECGGPLWEREEDGAKTFRCRIGHAYSPESLLDAENESVESALWHAVRSLEEGAAIARRVASLIPGASPEFEQRAKQRSRYAEVIRSLLSRHDWVQTTKDVVE